MTEIASYTDHHRLTLKLTPLLVGELFLAQKLKHPVYVFEGGVFRAAIPAGVVPSREDVNKLIRGFVREVFVYPEDREGIRQNLEAALIKVTRSLSVGDPFENGSRELKLLSLNLGSLYENPHDDKQLMLQFQSMQNLGKFMLEHRKLQAQFYQGLMQENFHFTLTQPMLSSIMLLSFLQATHLFHDKEIESLFLTSYLKDIGFGMIPRQKYDQKHLSERDRQLFSGHADFSHELLDGRVPLTKSQLTIIRHHHFLNEKIKLFLAPSDGGKDRDPDVVLGLESTLVAVFDILVAMTSDRPYRKGMSLFQALEVIKRVIADDYPQEFRALVVFLKQFHKN
jgi:hypothetical protein